MCVDHRNCPSKTVATKHEDHEVYKLLYNQPLFLRLEVPPPADSVATAAMAMLSPEPELADVTPKAWFLKEIDTIWYNNIQ